MGAATGDPRLNIKCIGGNHQLVFMKQISTCMDLPELLMHGKIGLKTHIIEIEPVILSAELPSLSSLVL